MKLRIITTGGTIDKVYFDAKSEFAVGEPQIQDVLKEAHVTFDFAVTPILKKDSLDLTDTDRALICQTVVDCPERHIIITHGTDTMVETALALQNKITKKIIILTGSLSPARFKSSDAIFNIGCAVAAVQSLAEGVYITMNGRIFSPEHVKKNREMNRFEEV